MNLFIFGTTSMSSMKIRAKTPKYYLNIVFMRRRRRTPVSGGGRSK